MDLVTEDPTLVEDDITLNGNEPAEPVEPKEPAAPKEDPLRKELTELTGLVKTLATPKQQEKTLTPEEQAEAWGIYDPEKGRKDFFQKFFRLNPDATPDEVAEAKAMFGDMQKGMVRQAIIGARNLLSKEFAALREELTPIKEHYSSARAEQTASRFYKSFPALAEETDAGKRYALVIGDVDATLANLEFDSEASYFKALADGAAERIKAQVPDFDLGAKPQPKPSAGTTPRLPRTSVGGTGGAGGGGGKSQATKSDDDSGSIDWTK